MLASTATRSPKGRIEEKLVQDASVTSTLPSKATVEIKDVPSGLNSGDMEVMQTDNSLGRKYDKKFFCPYCEIPQAKLPRHLITKHKDEREVIALESEKDPVAKRNALTKLRNLGNHRHNCDVIKKQTGQLIVAYRPSSDITPDSYVPCNHCLGYYVWYDLWKHARRCPLAPEDTSKTSRPLGKSRMLLPVPNGTSIGLKTVLDTMKSDDIGLAVKGDALILQLGEKLFLKNGHDREQFSYIRNTLRELARLLLELRKSCGEVGFRLTDFIDPVFFQKVVECARVVAGFQPTTHQYNIPSLALKIGHSIKKCAKIVESNGLQNGDDSLVMKASNFHKLCDMSWTEEVSTHALRTLNEQHRNKVRVIPLISDVTLMTQYLKKNGEAAFTKLSLTGNDIDAWKDLNEVALTQLMLFNRRRQGEASKVTLQDYTKQHTTTQEDLNHVLSPLEQKLCESLHRIEIVGKKGRTVPLIVTKEMHKWIDLLVSTRDEVGVNPLNKFLFPRCHYGSLSHIRGCDTLKDASEACGAKFPQLLRSTKLRKQIATLSQMLNLKENELDILATFMGHDIRVHREYYRLPEETLQVAKISKVLLSLENGNFTDNRGKSLDDIDVDLEEGMYTVHYCRHSEKIPLI